MFPFKPKIKCLIFMRKAKEYSLIKTIKISYTTTKFSYGTRTYHVDLEAIVSWKRSKPYLFYDLDELLPMRFRKSSIEHDSNEAYKFLQKKILDEITNKEADKFLMYIIAGLIIGVIAITVFSFWQYGKLNDTIRELTRELAKVSSGGVYP